MAATAPAPYQDSRWQADSSIEAAAAVRVELGAEEVAGANGEPALTEGDSPELENNEQQLLDDQLLGPLRREVELLEQQVQQQEVGVMVTEAECKEAEEELERQRDERMRLTVVLQQQQRAETRHQGASKLLQLQLTMTQQLNGVASSLAQVPAAEDRAWMPGALRQREQEVGALSAALRKQQQISQQAHAQLLELSTRRGGAAKGGRSEVEALSLRLAEQETARLTAEARADELQVLPRTRTAHAPHARRLHSDCARAAHAPQKQVLILEEQGLRSRLHKPPPLPRTGSAGSPVRAAATSPAMPSVTMPSRVIIPSERSSE
jgi:hypothetical protein